MASLGVKGLFSRQINTNDVFQELKASNEINNGYKEILSHIKEMDAYKSLRNVVMNHISSTLACKGGTLFDANTQKRKQIFEIRRMMYNIDSGISENISERMCKEDSRIAVRKAVKRLSDKKQNIIESNKKKARKSFQLQHKNYKPSTSIMEERDEFGPFPHSSLSVTPVSSVHASDLSNFDDQFSISSEDDDGKRSKKSISFFKANQLYQQKEFSKIIKKVHGAEMDVDLRKKRRSRSVASKSVHDTLPDVRPSRERKPNLKYFGEEMFLIKV